MTRVRIYQPSKTAMQSGKRKTKKWVVEFETDDPRITEPLVGWVTAHDMSQELRLSFPSLKEALHFATMNGFSYIVCNPCKISMSGKNYAFNFTCSRIRGA